MKRILAAVVVAVALLVPTAVPASAAVSTGYDEWRAASAMRDAWKRTPDADRIDTCRAFDRHNSQVIGYFSRMLVNRVGADRTWARAFIYRFFAGRCLRYGY